MNHSLSLNVFIAFEKTNFSFLFDTGMYVIFSCFCSKHSKDKINMKISKMSFGKNVSICICMLTS